MTECYLVVQVGIYTHGIFGPFTTLDGAKDYADALAKNDVDSYHGYAVLRTRTPLGLPPANGFGYDEDFTKVLYSVTKHETQKRTATR